MRSIFRKCQERSVFMKGWVSASPRVILALKHHSTKVRVILSINKQTIKSGKPRFNLFSQWEGFPDRSAVKESSCNAGDPNSIPGSGRSAGEGIGCPLQYSWASLVAQLVKNLPAMLETWIRSLVGKIPWRRERLPLPVFWPEEFPSPP